jgi:hypothetical protein
MNWVRQLTQDWPSRLALVLCFTNPVLMFTRGASLPEDILGWILFVPAVILLSAFLSAAEILMLVFMRYASRRVSRWSLLAVSAGATAWVAYFVTYPFKTASSMAVTIMNASMIGVAGAVVIGGLILHLGKRIR